MRSRCLEGIATRIAVTLFISLVVASCFSGRVAQAQANAQQLSQRLNKLLDQKNFKDATPLLKQLIQMQEKSGARDAPETLQNIDVLATLHISQNQFVEAETLLKALLARREQLFGNESAELINTLTRLGAVYHFLNKSNEALSLLLRGARISELKLPPDHPTTLMCMRNLALAYAKSNQYAKAEPLFVRVIAAQERKNGPDQPGSDVDLQDLAGVYYALGNFAQAERLYLRALDIKRKTRGEDNADTLRATHLLAQFYGEMGNYPNAAELYNRVIQARERISGPEDLATLSAVGDLALLYAKYGAYKAAEPLLLRVYQADVRLRGADEKLTIGSLQNLAVAYRELGQYEKAEPLFVRLLAANERTAGRDGSDTLNVTLELASIYARLKQPAKAEELYNRILKSPGAGSGIRSSTLAGLAEVHLMRGDWQQARSLLVRHLGNPEEGGTNAEQRALAAQNGRKVVIKLSGRLVQEGREPPERSGAETFEMAQRLLNSEAAQSVRRMAVRSLPRDGRLEATVRKSQDLSNELQRLTAVGAQLWNSFDTMFLKKFNYSSEKGFDIDEFPVLGRDRVIDTQANNAAKIAAVNARIRELDVVLAREFAQYGELMRPQPLSVTEVQAQLAPNEAVVVFLDTGPAYELAGETFVWVVTKTQLRWARSDLDTDGLAREVQALRCGLDLEAWSGRDCASLVGSHLLTGRCERRPAAALCSRSGLSALSSTVRPGERHSRWQASLRRPVRRVDAVAVPCAGNGRSRWRFSQGGVAGTQPCDHCSACGFLAEGVACHGTR